VLLRPIALDDGALLTSALERMGDTTRYRRFLAQRSVFTDVELEYLTDVDHHDHEALIAIDMRDGEAIGVARYIRIAPRTAELAVTVVDDWQGHGVGSLLLRQLAKRARRADIDRFVAVTVAGNEPALRLLARLPRATRLAADAHVQLGARVPGRWKLGPRRRRRRQTLNTVQALTPGAP